MIEELNAFVTGQHPLYPGVKIDGTQTGTSPAVDLRIDLLPAPSDGGRQGNICAHVGHLRAGFAIRAAPLSYPDCHLSSHVLGVHVSAWLEQQQQQQQHLQHLAAQRQIAGRAFASALGTHGIFARVFLGAYISLTKKKCDVCGYLYIYHLWPARPRACPPARAQVPRRRHVRARDGHAATGPARARSVICRTHTDISRTHTRACMHAYSLASTHTSMHMHTRAFSYRATPPGLVTTNPRARNQAVKTTAT